MNSEITSLLVASILWLFSVYFFFEAIRHGRTLIALTWMLCYTLSFWVMIFFIVLRSLKGF